MIGGVLVLGGGACVVITTLAIVGARAELDKANDPPAPPSLTATPTTTTAPIGTSLAPMGDEPEPPTNKQGAAPKSAPSTASKGGASWWCNASASVRVCGFAGACNYQMVFGNGGGNDRFIASQQAKNACEAMARAKGASAVCVVQCSPR